MTALEHALWPRLEAELGAMDGGDGAGSACLTQAPPRALGPFLLDLRPLLGADLDAARCREAAQRLQASGVVHHAVAVPPRLYLTPHPADLSRSVVSACLDPARPYGHGDAHDGEVVLLSFSDPNLNKPLHVGHLRNNFLGMAVAALLEAQGAAVERQASHLDWGIDIAKALHAYREWGSGATPEASGRKGDHFVGGHYVAFHAAEGPRDEGDKSWAEVEAADEARATPLEREARALLARMDAGEADLLAENHHLTRWAEEGITATYARIGTRIDALFHEGDHLEEGRRLTESLDEAGLLEARPDGSVGLRLGDDAAHATFLRADATPTIYRQWLATDIHRFAERSFDRALFLWGKEWREGFEVFSAVLSRLGHHWVDRIELVAHGMVSLPDGPMASRSGRTVGADELLDRVAERLVAGGGDPGGDAEALGDALGVALLKYLCLRVPPAEDMAFDEEALWTHVLPRFARLVRALAGSERMAAAPAPHLDAHPSSMSEPLVELLLELNRFPAVAARSAERLEPVVLVRYLDGLALAVTRARGAAGAGDPVWAAAASVMRRALALLNVELPELPGRLPPAFEDRRPEPLVARP